MAKDPEAFAHCRESRLTLMLILREPFSRKTSGKDEFFRLAFPTPRAVECLSDGRTYLLRLNVCRLISDIMEIFPSN